MRIAAEFAHPTRNQKLLKTLRTLFIALLVAAAVAAASYVAMRGAASGSKTQLTEAFLVATLPLVLYFAISKPFIFPFGLFVVLIPVENLLAINASNVGASARVPTLEKLLGLASGLAFVFWLIRNKRFIKPPRAALMWLALLMWMSLSSFWAIDPNQAVGSLTTYAELVALYVVISIMPLTPDEFRTFLAAVVLGGLVIAVLSIYQFHTGGQFHAQVVGAAIVGKTNADIDPNEITAVLLLPIALVSMAILRRKWSLEKLAFMGLLAVLLGAVYVTSSRGGVVALGTLMAYLMLRSRYKVQVALLFLTGLGASMASGAAPTSIWGRFAQAAKTGGSGRLSIWAVGWHSFKHHWLVGAGVGNFPVAYRQSFIHIYQFVNAGWNRVSHNTPLGLAVELGVIGVLIAIAAGYQQWRMLGFIAKSDPLYDLRIALESAAAGLFVASVFLWVMPGKYTWLTLELMAATRAFALCRPGWHYALQSRSPTALCSDDGSHRRLRQKVPANAVQIIPVIASHPRTG